MRKKKVDIGLRQLYRICNMPYEERLIFIAKGLPYILESAQDYYHTSKVLNEESRSREVLLGQAREEASKILILLDAVRCPKKRISRDIGKITGWYYDHLARLIYDESLTFRPDNIARLKNYIQSIRASHYLDGNMGEFIYPNMALYQRESRLYVDAAVIEEDEIIWASPLHHGFYPPLHKPDSLGLTEAIDEFGLLSKTGVTIIAQIWERVDFTNKVGFADAKLLTEKTLSEAVKMELPKSTCTDNHARTIIEMWQWPMYDFDLSPIERSLDEMLEEQRQLRNWRVRSNTR